MRKRKMKFNLMDVLILLAVAAVAAVLLYVFVFSENTPVDSLGGTPTTKITYVVELTAVEDGLSDNISVGETLVDAAKKMNIGTIVAVETQPYVYLGKNLTNGTMELTTVVAEAARMVRLEHGPESFPMDFMGVAIGNIALFGIPGEPFTGVGRGLKEAKGWEVVMPTCLTNGSEGYFPMQDSYDEGGYEARSSRYKAGTAELIISEGKALLDGLR